MIWIRKQRKIKPRKINERNIKERKKVDEGV